MNKISQIYQEYKIMPSLALHMFRVAGVAMQICENLLPSVVIDKKSIIQSCLLHDMGNIIKFKLDVFPEFNQPEGLEYWQKVQSEFKEKYGLDEHEANLKIAQDLQMPLQVLQNIDGIGFEKWDNVKIFGNLEQKICVYADSRVSPFGVVPLKERLAEGEKRYKGMYPLLDAKREVLYLAMQNIENEIFLQSKISPFQITEDSVLKYIEELKSFEI